MLITSLDNDNVKRWCKLKEKKYRDKSNSFIIEGEHLVLEALKKGYVQEVILEKDVLFPVEIPRFFVTKEILKKITSLDNPPSMIAICQKLHDTTYGNHLLLIDSIQNPGNLGTIIRTAVAFAIDTIVLGDDTVDIYNEKVLRATQGLIFHTNILKRNLPSFIKELKSKDYQILGTNVTHGKPVENLNLQNKYAYILGNEGRGVDPAILKLCDEYIYIPMSDECESLNVAVASGIILYELNKKGDEK